MVAAWQAAWREALHDAAIRARLEGLGFVIHASTPQDFGRSLAESEARFAEVIAAAGIRAEDG